VNIDNWVFEYT